MQEIKERHGAVIRVSKGILLKMLDFEGGVIHRVYEPEAYINPDYFCVVIEHPDLPATPINQILPEITPVYQTFFVTEGNLVKMIKIERIKPEKKALV